MANHKFNLPEIGEGVNEGEIVQWLVPVGQSVTEDQALVEIMTDKATVEIAAPIAGTVASHAAAEGDSVDVGSLLAEITPAGSAAAAPSPAQTSPAAATTDNSNVVAMPQNTVASPTASIAAPSAQDTPVLASPATRKLAREQGISLSQLTGSGKNGRILKDDLEKFIASGSSASPVSNNTANTVGNTALTPNPVPNTAPAVTPTFSSPAKENKALEERIPLRGIRKAIAKNMIHSKNTAAHFTHVNELEADNLVAVRNSLKEEAAQKGVKLTYIPFIIKAICAALKNNPRVNSSLDEEAQEIVIKNYYNICIAVATKDDDLIVPVIKNADQKSLLELANEITQLADKARNNKLSPSDLQGGTFTITSMGNKGGLFATPIINYPQVGILGFYKIADRVVVRDGQMVMRKIANLSVSIDHRIVDGMLAANFLADVIANLENPSRMLL